MASDSDLRPRRSVLYMPAANDRALEKAQTIPADAIIFDLEDAVAVDEKANARALLTGTLVAGGYGNRVQIIRLNGAETEWGGDDLAAAMEIGPQAVLLPICRTTRVPMWPCGTRAVRRRLSPCSVPPWRAFPTFPSITALRTRTWPPF